jgi:hypothetical protein
MKPTTFNYKGYSFSIIGNVPSGKSCVKMFEHINSLNTDKATFKMEVEQYNLVTVSEITFSKITK